MKGKSFIVAGTIEEFKKLTNDEDGEEISKWIKSKLEEDVQEEIDLSVYEMEEEY